MNNIYFIICLMLINNIYYIINIDIFALFAIFNIDIFAIICFNYINNIYSYLSNINNFL